MFFHTGTPKSTSRRLIPVVMCLMLPSLPGCSIRGYALRFAADAVSSAGGGYGEEEDPDLVRYAAASALETMEQLHKEVPDHPRLPLSLAAGFTQYGYAFVQQDADRAEDKDFKRSQELLARARRLYLRGRNHALDGLERRHKGLRQALLAPKKEGRAEALMRAGKDDVPLLYWAGASWALAISTAKDHMDLVGDLPVVEEIIARALALDEAWDSGAIHEFYVSYDAARSKEAGGGPERARQHLDRAMALSGGHRVGPLLSYAEGVLVPQQKKAEFTQMLNKVLEADVYADDDAWRKERLANVINQDRAHWLLTRLGDLFAE